MPETSDLRPTVKQSLMNFRKNALIVTMLLVLVVALLAIKAPHYESIWSVLLIFVVKEESRPQPVPVVLLAFATTIAAILVLSNFRGMGRFCEVATHRSASPTGLIQVAFSSKNRVVRPNVRMRSQSKKFGFEC